MDETSTTLTDFLLPQPSDSGEDVQGDRSMGGRFQVGTLRFYTRTSEAYDAVETVSGETLLLWTLRARLMSNSEVATRFARRLEAIQRFGKGVVTLKTFGVDTCGVAYATTEPVQGQLLVEVKATPAQLEQLYIKALLTVSSLHDQGIVLGDISEHSFVIDPENNVILQTLLGTFELEARHTALLPPVATLHYVAPEQRGGGGCQLADDVYSLGVLAYRLFTGRYPYGDQPPMDVNDARLENVPAPSVVNHDIPNWVDNFVSKCVEPQLENRYSDVNVALNVLEEAIRIDTPPLGSGRWSRRTLIVRPRELRSQVGSRSSTDQGKSTDNRKSQRVSRQTKTQETTLPRNFKVTLAIVFGIALGVIGAGVAFVMVGNNFFPPENWQKNVVLLIEGAHPELQAALVQLVKNSLPVEKQVEHLRTIAQSDDPTATAILITVLKSAPNKELLAAAEELIAERMKRQGLHRTGFMMERWFQGIQEVGRKPAQSPAFSDIFRACDSTLPFDARKLALEKAYGREPIIAIQFAAALALDDESHDKFTQVLGSLLSDHLKQKELEGKSLGVLILSYRNLFLFFGQDVQKLIGEFSANDLGYSLLALAESNSDLLYTIVEETSKRGIVPPFQTVFLKILLTADHFATPGFIRKSLIHSARGELTGEDISNFSHWGSNERERVLLASAAIAQTPTLAVAAFDGLVGIAIQEEPGKSLIKWIEKRHWNDREKAVKAIAILGLWDIASPEQINYAFDELMPFASDGQFFTTLVQAGKPVIVKTAIERVGAITPNAELTPLLSHTEKEVRLAAVKALVGRNDLYVLQAISRAYAAEKDEELKKVYRELYWVVRDRK